MQKHVNTNKQSSIINNFSLLQCKLIINTNDRKPVYRYSI